MLKSCFHADISPSLAESILIKQKPASYLVRQGDRDPSKLILSFYKDGRTKHIVIPDFGTEGCNRRLVKDRLDDTSYEVDKLLVSYDCRLVLCHINTTQHEHDFCLFIFFQLINLDFMLSWSQYLNINMTSSSVEVGLQLFIYYQHIKWWGYFKCLENCQ